LESVGLSTDELARIGWKTAARLLGIGGRP
jgi:hypothetical protein